MIDASDPKIEDRIRVTDEILESIGANQPRRYIFNQIDKLSDDQLNDLKQKWIHYDPLFVSAFDGSGLPLLKNVLSQMG